MSNAQGLGIFNVSLIVGTIAALAAGQVLFKMASETVSLIHPASFLSLPLIVALFVYGLATVAWLVVLSRVPLSVAFPFYGLSFFFVPVLSSMFLGERIRLTTLLGAVVIAAGIYICSKE